MRKKLAFAVIVISIFGAGIELLLALVGVTPSLASHDPYVGFESSIPLFEEVRDEVGRPVYRTARNKRDIFNDQTFRKRKGPEEFRIFCMGGSTTHGRPYKDRTSFCGWLRVFLRAADPSREWTVVNCGGVSYASYRVATLMEELVGYDPDLFVVYTGHNEFLERRTYHGIIEEHPVFTTVNVLMHRSRLVSLLRSALHRVTASDRQTALKQYQLTGEVRPVLDTTAGLDLYHRDEGLRRQILDHYRFNLGRMVAIARMAGAEIVFVEPATNLKDFSPFKSEHQAGLTAERLAEWDRLVSAGDTELAEKDFAAARGAYAEALRIDDRFARLHFQLGRALMGLSEYDAARVAFVRAIEEDVCPLRILPAMKRIVREVAERYAAPLIDFPLYLERDAGVSLGHSVLGEEYFLDHVHLTIAVHRMLGGLLLDHLVNRGTVHVVADWTEQRQKTIVDELESSLNKREHALARGTLARVLRWAGKYDEADRIVESVADVLEETVDGLTLLGERMERQGQPEGAMSYFEKAVRLSPGAAEARLSIARLLLERGDVEAAAAAYSELVRDFADIAAAHHGLGVALHKLGRAEEAIKCFKRVLGVDQNYPNVHISIGMALMDQGRPQEAIDELRSALEADPTSVVALTQLGVLHRQLRQSEESLRYFRKALAIAPNEPVVHNALGYLYAVLGEIKDARLHYERAIESDPTFAEAHFNLARVLVRQGHYAEAVVHFDSATAHANDSPIAVRALFESAWLLATAPNNNARNGAQAVRSAERACTYVPPDDPRCLAALAAAYAEVGDFVGAADNAERGIEAANAAHLVKMANDLLIQLEGYKHRKPHRMATIEPRNHSPERP